MTSAQVLQRSSVLREMLAAYPGLPPAERRIADVIFDRPSEVLRWTSTQLAAQAGSSQPATSRLCARLSTKAFSNFKVRLAQEIGHELAGEQSDDGSIAPIGERNELIAQILARTEMDLSAAERAVATLDETVLVQSAKALRGARTIVVCGFDLSGSVASRLANLLYLIGLPARSERDPTQARWLDALGAGDVLIVVSYRGQMPHFLPTVRRVRDGGTTIIAITNEAQTQLAQLADHLVLTLAPAALTDDDYIAGPALYVQLAAARALWMAVKFELDTPVAS